VIGGGDLGIQELGETEGLTVGLNILTMSRSLDPLQLPSVSLTQRNHLPACSAIYFALDSSNRVLYVGKAKNLASRWKNHHRLHKLKEINQNPLYVLLADLE
jgi:hypothetical protein